MRRVIFQFTIIIFLLLSVSNGIVSAQTEPVYPTYIIQEGDTLSSIASLFRTTVNDILAINQFSNPDNLTIGTSINIPGMDGVSGTLILYPINIEDSPLGISRIHQLSVDSLSNINQLTTPHEFYVGRSLIIPQNDYEEVTSALGSLKQNESIFSIAVQQKVNPWTLVLENYHTGSNDIMPGEILYGHSPEGLINTLSPYVNYISVSPLPLYQGNTFQIIIRSDQAVSFTGSIGDHSLFFFPINEHEFIALQGIGAQESAGITPIKISGTTSLDESFTIEKNILINSGNYGEDTPLFVDPITIDPSTIMKEEALITPVISQVTSEKLWTEPFHYPIDEPCIGGDYGGSRIYNGTYSYYHTGVDFVVCASNTNVYASAPGVVAFTGSTIIRGNAILIDHGWGIFSSYYHLSQILVNEGDLIETGQLIGYVGNTGRSTGYHLHWEIWVNGIQVEPISWINNTYPLNIEN